MGLQYIAIVAFLLWGLTSSLAGVIANNPDAARLVRRRRHDTGRQEPAA